MAWSKEADWLPVSNAVAQVVFWKDDLQKAEHFVDVLEGMGVPKNNQMMIIAIKDIEVSKKGLKKSQIKLKQTYKRVYNKEL